MIEVPHRSLTKETTVKCQDTPQNAYGFVRLLTNVLIRSKLVWKVVGFGVKGLQVLN